MRLLTILGTGLIAISTLAMAQVVNGPIEQKNLPQNSPITPGNDMLANGTDAPANSTAAEVAPEVPAPGNVTGDPAAASSAPRK
jgi:hypothetical protein